VPPEEIRRLRTHTRYRRRLVQVRTAQKARREKLPEDGHLKLSPVISDIQLRTYPLCLTPSATSSTGLP
jgi:hypothetical protein